MKINLYKLNKDMNMKSLESYLTEENYQKVPKTYNNDGSTIYLFKEVNERNQPEWYNVLEGYFDIDFSFDAHLNIILVIVLPQTSFILFLLDKDTIKCPLKL